MKKLFSTTLLAGALCFCASLAHANDAKSYKEVQSVLIKASYALPKEDGDEFRQTLHEADEENLNTHQQIMLDHADMYDLLVADEFNKKAFLAKAQEVRNLQEQEKANRDDAFAAAVTQLPVDERVKLAAALESNAASKPVHHAHKKHMSGNAMPAQ